MTNHHRARIIGAISDVSEGKVPFVDNVLPSGKKCIMVWEKLLPFRVLWLLFRSLRYREAATWFSQDGIVRYELFIHICTCASSVANRLPSDPSTDPQRMNRWYNFATLIRSRWILNSCFAQAVRTPCLIRRSFAYDPQ